MKILITGGGGVLGRHLAYKLTDQEHEVYIADIDMYDVDQTKVDKCLQFDLTKPGELYNLALANTPDVIVHLAEVALTESSIHMSAVRVNVCITAEMIQTCVKLNIRGIVGAWEPLVEYDMMTQSLNVKAEMPRYYGKGNAVINVIRMPCILHPEYPSAQLGAIITRLYNHIDLGHPFIIEDSESDFDTYCTVDMICESIIDQIQRRTRKTCHVPRQIISLNDLIGIALDVFEYNSVTLYGREEPREFKRITTCKDGDLYRWIKQEWSSLIDFKGTSS